MLVAHVQEPGANDDGSGCGTLYGLARALVTAIKAGALPRPERTLTFMWVDEVRGSRQWITSHPDEARGVQYMFAMDMTGEDTAKTGGTFPDRETGRSVSRVGAAIRSAHGMGCRARSSAETLKGSLLNDLHLAVCLRRARDTRWVVQTNPYEGGSDHTRIRLGRDPVAAELALHRSLLPHEPGSSRQGQRGGNEERGNRGSHFCVAACGCRASRMQPRSSICCRARHSVASRSSASRERSWREGPSTKRQPLPLSSA